MWSVPTANCVTTRRCATSFAASGRWTVSSACVWLCWFGKPPTRSTQPPALSSALTRPQTGTGFRCSFKAECRFLLGLVGDEGGQALRFGFLFGGQRQFRHGWLRVPRKGWIFKTRWGPALRYEESTHFPYAYPVTTSWSTWRA